jgi:hypothetical protein
MHPVTTLDCIILASILVLKEIEREEDHSYYSIPHEQRMSIRSSSPIEKALSSTESTVFGFVCRAEYTLIS